MPSRARWFAAGGRGAFRPRLRRNWFAELARQRAFNGPGDPRLERALCIAAHPDDVDFFAAGTVLLMTGRGVTVDLVLVTSGDKGTRDPAREAEELAATREREQLASAGCWGPRGSSSCASRTPRWWTTCSC